MPPPPPPPSPHPSINSCIRPWQQQQRHTAACAGRAHAASDTAAVALARRSAYISISVWRLGLPAKARGSRWGRRHAPFGFQHVYHPMLPPWQQTMSLNPWPPPPPPPPPSPQFRSVLGSQHSACSTAGFCLTY